MPAASMRARSSSSRQFLARSQAIIFSQTIESAGFQGVGVMPVSTNSSGQAPSWLAI